jgi:hypothetical protein
VFAVPAHKLWQVLPWYLGVRQHEIPENSFANSQLLQGIIPIDCLVSRRGRSPGYCFLCTDVSVPGKNYFENGLKQEKN